MHNGQPRLSSAFFLIPVKPHNLPVCCVLETSLTPAVQAASHWPSRNDPSNQAASIFDTGSNSVTAKWHKNSNHTLLYLLAVLLSLALCLDKDTTANHTAEVPLSKYILVSQSWTLSRHWLVSSFHVCISSRNQNFIVLFGSEFNVCFWLRLINPNRQHKTAFDILLTPVRWKASLE